MEVYKAIYDRRSARSFDPKKNVSSEVVDKILEAACQAPSAGDIQPWRFFVVRDQTTKDRLAAKALNQKFISEAPVVIVVCADVEISGEAYGDRGRTLFAIQDAACATQNILLAANSEGLGSCWVGSFYEDDIRRILNIELHVRPMTIVPIGYVPKGGKKPSRMAHEAVVTYID
ncbi:MAG: nitroreductase family protein [Actinomycetota bacterium]|nr:nitroreductase family protein [Actinomycetota bacterium]